MLCNCITFIVTKYGIDREREAGIGRYPGSIATDFDGVVMCYGRMSMSG